MLVIQSNKPHDIAMYLDDSVTKDRSGWVIIVKQGGRPVLKDNCAYKVMTSSLTKEVEAATLTIQQPASTRDTQITNAIILTDARNLLQKVECEVCCHQWYKALNSLWLQRLLQIYCPCHCGVRGNGWLTDWPTQQTSQLVYILVHLGRAKVLRGLRNLVNVDKPELHSTVCLKEKRVEKGSGWSSTSSLWGRKKNLCSTRHTLVLFKGQPWRDCWKM